MSTSNEKRKYNIIFIVVTIVMCIRCLGREFIKNFDMTLLVPAILMIVWVIVYCIWGTKVINRLYERGIDTGFVLLILFSIMSASILSGGDYMGSVQSVMLIVTILDVYVIATNGSVILMIILPAIGILLDRTYLFAYMGCIVILLLFNMYVRDAVKYLTVLIINIIETVAVFIIYNYYGIAEETVGFPALYVSLFRVGLTILLTVPFSAFFVIIFERVLVRKKKSRGVPPRFIYKLWMIGGITVAPLFFMINNFGTWFFVIGSYYILTSLGLIIMDNKVVTRVFGDVLSLIRLRYKWLVILLLYAIFFTPIDSVKVGMFVDNFISW